MFEAYIGGFLHFLYQLYSPVVLRVSALLPRAMRVYLGQAVEKSLKSKHTGEGIFMDS